MSMLFDATAVAAGFCNKHKLKFEDALDLLESIIGVNQRDTEDEEIREYITREWANLHPEKISSEVGER